MTGVLSGILIAAALVVAGCGSVDHAGESHDIATRVKVVALTRASAGRESTATPLPSARAASWYAEQLAGANLTGFDAAAAALKPADGELLYAQVVAVGCHAVPAGTVSAIRNGDVVTLTSDFTEASPTECFATVTSVALALVSD